MPEDGPQCVFQSILEGKRQMNDLNRALIHLLNSLMLAIRYGLIAMFISGGVGVGCRKWPLIKQAAPVVEGINK